MTRVFLIFFLLFLISIQSAWTQNTTQPLNDWETRIQEHEKNLWKIKVKEELIRSEIILFVSFPFFFLYLNLIYGDGGSDRFLNYPGGYSFLSTEIAYLLKKAETNDNSKNIIERPTYHSNVFNATEFYVLFVSILWAFSISFNNIYENLILKNPLKTSFSFSKDRFSLNLFTLYF